jgi:hypothetical protein
MAGLELLEIANVEKSKVCSLVGDIGGVLLQGSGLDEAKQVEVDSIRQLWTGIQPHHYRRIAASGGAQRGGVVVLAIDANKCDAALRAIELGWVTRLACDRHLAAAIAKRCDVPLKLQRAGS